MRSGHLLEGGRGEGASSSTPKISELGESGLLFELGEKPDIGIQKKVWFLARQLAQHPDLNEVMPGIGNIAVFFDPTQKSARAITELVLQELETFEDQPLNGALHTVPTRYGGEYGPDLNQVAEARGLTPGELIERHSAVEYVVAAIGSMPGFPYLLGLDEKLFMPRRSTPRIHVRFGSIIIGAGLCAIMTRASASGWHIIGNADMVYFDPMRQKPATFAPGDRIRFQPMSPPA